MLTLSFEPTPNGTCDQNCGTSGVVRLKKIVAVPGSNVHVLAVTEVLCKYLLVVTGRSRACRKPGARGAKRLSDGL